MAAGGALCGRRCGSSWRCCSVWQPQGWGSAAERAAGQLNGCSVGPGQAGVEFLANSTGGSQLTGRGWQPKGHCVRPAGLALGSGLVLGVGSSAELGGQMAGWVVASGQALIAWRGGACDHGGFGLVDKGGAYGGK